MSTTEVIANLGKPAMWQGTEVIIDGIVLSKKQAIVNLPTTKNKSEPLYVEVGNLEAA